MATSDARSFTLKPRRGGMRRILRATLVLFVAVLLGHRVWTWQAERRLRLRIGVLQAAGELVRPSDFEVGQPEGYGNAATDLTAAAAILDDNTVHSLSVDCVPATQPVAAEMWPYLTAAVEWFEPALRRVDRAQSEPYGCWSHSFQSPVMMNLRAPELDQCRSLAFLLTTSSQVEHHRAHDDLVVRRLQQMLLLANECEHTPTFVAHATSLGITSMATRHMEAVAPDLRIGATTGSADSNSVRTLVAALIDESSITAGLRASLQAGRMERLDFVDSFASAQQDFVAPLVRYGMRTADLSRRDRMHRSIGVGLRSRIAVARLADGQGSLERAPSADRFCVSRR